MTALVPDFTGVTAIKVIGLGGVGGPVARYLASGGSRTRNVVKNDDIFVRHAVYGL